jgi:hypothetical protein
MNNGSSPFGKFCDPFCFDWLGLAVQSVDSDLRSLRRKTHNRKWGGIYICMTAASYVPINPNVLVKSLKEVFSEITITIMGYVD